MRLLKALLAWFLVALGPALAADTGWGAVKAKILASQDYSFSYHYVGSDGDYRFSYAYSAPGVIRQEILPGSPHEGTIVFYDPGKSTDYVTVRAGFIQLHRSTRSEEIADTSLIHPLLQQIVERVEACQGPTVTASGKLRLFQWQGTQQHEIWVNERDEVVRYRVSEQGKTVEELELGNIQWNTGKVPSL